MKTPEEIFTKEVVLEISKKHGLPTNIEALRFLANSLIGICEGRNHPLQARPLSDTPKGKAEAVKKAAWNLKLALKETSFEQYNLLDYNEELEIINIIYERASEAAKTRSSTGGLKDYWLPAACMGLQDTLGSFGKSGKIHKGSNAKPGKQNEGKKSYAVEFIFDCLSRIDPTITRHKIIKLEERKELEGFPSDYP